jgi:chromatin segregation and condensation protein Rec8/ScpA/Scc1 (kleisin family)
VKERTTNLKAELVPVRLEEGGQRLVLGLTEHKAKASPVTHAQQKERERERFVSRVGQTDVKSKRKREWKRTCAECGSA